MKGFPALMARHGDTMAKLADFLGVNINTVWRWKSGQNAPALETQRAICGRYGCSMDELLNGPQKKEFTVLLKFAKTIEEVEEEMIREQFSLTVTEDGYVGASGLAMFNSEQDIEDAIAKIRFNLEQGYETKKRMAEESKRGRAQG